MKLELFAEKLFAAGKESGFTDMEVFFSGGSSFRAGVFKGEIDNYTLAESSGLSFRGIYNGKMGYAFTEKLDEESIDMLINDAQQNAIINDSEDVEEIFAGSAEYAEVDAYSQELANATTEQKLALVHAIEKAAYALDDRIATVQAFFGGGASERRIINNKGLNLAFQGNTAMLGVSVIARQGQETKTAYGREVARDLAEFDVDKIAKEAVDEAVSLFGADTIVSKDYPIILRNDVAAQLLAVFAPAFSAENVQKGLSLLRGKIGEQIYDAKITIVDDPHMPGKPGSCPFDAEGVATYKKNVVEDGVLKTYLHNLKTARQDGVESTGNASKRSYKSSIGISPSNFYIQPGEVNYDEMIKGTKEGLIIISLQGTHSGANPVSGDFSLAAYGYLVQDGAIVGPVHQITVAGNYYQMMREVLQIGNDLYFGGGSYGAPSLKIARLAVAGK
ncbi:MAG: TldD/PmbA family protein [Firmicutes bacterium]|nr:TldD/PmbA family protein [Bacillota bacterium]